MNVFYREINLGFLGIFIFVFKIFELKYKFKDGVVGRNN